MTATKKIQPQYVKKLLYNSKKKEAFLSIPLSKQGKVFLTLSTYLQKAIISSLTDTEIISFLNYLDPNKATEVLYAIDPVRRKTIISKINTKLKEKMSLLLRFDTSAAAKLMDLNYITVEKNYTFKKVVNEVAKHEEKTGIFPIILITEKNRLVGELPGYFLAFQDRNTKIEKYLKKIPALKYNASENELVKTLKKHRNGKLVVLDENDTIIGTIHAKDILGIIENEATQTIYRFAGVKKEEDALDPVKEKVRNRYKWLIINLGTAFLASMVIKIFEGTIEKAVLLAVYMPIIAGMGGNAGTQTMAVVVRGLALNKMDWDISKKIILNEVEASALQGLINGTIVFVISYVVNRNLIFSIVLFLAMIINLINAGFFGTVIPLIMKRLGKDPATSATIFITTATDVIGFLVFLGLATFLLSNI